MTDEPENIVSICLRRLDEKMDRLSDEMRDIKQRLGHVEINLAHVERIARRLDLAET
jgi:hypothetical protein